MVDVDDNDNNVDHDDDDDVDDDVDDDDDDYNESPCKNENRTYPFFFLRNHLYRRRRRRRRLLRKKYLHLLWHLPTPLPFESPLQLSPLAVKQILQEIKWSFKLPCHPLFVRL